MPLSFEGLIALVRCPRDFKASLYVLGEIIGVKAGPGGLRSGAPFRGPGLDAGIQGGEDCFGFVVSALAKQRGGKLVQRVDVAVAGATITNRIVNFDRCSR